MKTVCGVFSILFFIVACSFSSSCQPAQPSPEPASSPRPERRAIGGLVWRRQDYRDYLTKATKQPAFIARTIELSGEEFMRAQKLLQTGIVRQHLLDEPSPIDATFSLEKLSKQLLISGPAELAVRLETLVEDEMTFLLATRQRTSENTLAILSLVDPVFLETNPRLASLIAEANYDGVRRIVKPENDDYRRAGKRIRFNRQLGTVTILDRPQKIEEVRQYLDIRPYAPRPKTY